MKAKIIYSEAIEKSKFDYKDFIKGIQLPDDSTWLADIVKFTKK